MKTETMKTEMLKSENRTAAQIMADQTFVGIPWKDGGRDFAGADCAGLAWLWLTQQAGFTGACPKSHLDNDIASLLPGHFNAAELRRGDAVFFNARGGKIQHVAIYLGHGKVLHILNGFKSRIENGFALLKRVGLEPVGALNVAESEKLAAALNHQQLGWSAVIGIIISLILSAISYALRPGIHTAKHGAYSQYQLLTVSNTETPLPDLLGQVTVAGNAVYRQLPSKKGATAGSTEMWNEVIVLGSGPSNGIDYRTGLKINGTTYSDGSFFSGAAADGIRINPAQTNDEAVKGTVLYSTAHISLGVVNITNNSQSNVPSISLYLGAHDLAVPIDIRAQYDRDFPVYGFSGCTYLVGRWANSTNFGNVNLTCVVNSRLCRTFDSSGFLTTTVTNETPPSGTNFRQKLANADLIAVTAVSVGGTAYTEMSATNQTGNVYRVNYLKGYVEFPTSISGLGAVLVSYTYYPRTWSQNPAAHVVYLLTEPVRGKGFDASRIDWVSMDAARTYFDVSVTWQTTNGPVTGARYQTNYAVDDRKPLTDHLNAITDACNSLLFFSGGKFVLLPKQPGSSVFSFSPSNILVDDQGKSSFEATLMDRTNKINRVKLLFQNSESFNAETSVLVDDETSQRDRAARIGNNGVVEDNLKFPAVTDQGQAERLAEMILREQVDSKWVYNWKTNIQGLPLQPGDLVDLTHPSLPGAGAKVLRLDNVGMDENDRMILTASEYVESAYV